jgi:aminoglycoside phosphotransferase (APT) family kinase protein
MAVINRIDLQTFGPRLAEWLSETTGSSDKAVVSNVALPSGTGLSSETMLFTASWTESGEQRTENLVARVAPTGEVLHLQYDLEAQFEIMKALGDRTAVPVPRALWFESDPSALGAPFLVMSKAEGQVPPDDPPFPLGGWVADLPESDQALLYDNGLQALAAIHQVTPRNIGLHIFDDSRHGLNGLDQKIDYYERLFRLATGGRANPTVEAALEWLKANKPEEPLPVLNWGDARIGNMVFGSDLSVSAVLDWELAGTGSPEADLGWWLFMDRHHTEGVGAPKVPGFPDRAAAIERYQELTGYTVQNLHYYEVFAGLGTAVHMVRIAELLVNAGVLPPEADMALNNPGSVLLARSLGLPAPEGDTHSLI